MRKLWVIIALLLIAVMSCNQGMKGVDAFFPSEDFETGWAWEGKPQHFFPENLYEYINGEAELYLAYGFIEMSTLTYYWGSPDDIFLTVNIYDMGTPINGFGVYSNFRYPGYEVTKIGTEALISDYGIKFYKGRYFVDVSSSDTSEKNKNAVRKIAGLIAEAIPGLAESPALLKLMPVENRIPNTLRYVGKEMLNQAFLPAGLEAHYDLDGQDVTGFVVIFDTPEKAREGLENLKSFYTEIGSKFRNSALPGELFFAVETNYQGKAILSQQGKYMAGIQNLKKMDQGIPLMKMIFTELQKTQ